MSILKTNIQEVRDTDKRSLEFLSMTRNLTNETKFPFEVWNWLKTQYEHIDESDPVVRAECSVINAILHQERIVFALSKRGLQDLMKNDKNFKGIGKGVGFKDSYYSKIRRNLYSRGIVRLVEEFKGKGDNASGFEVIDSGLLEYLNRTVNRDNQYTQVKNYCEKSNTKAKGTSEGTTIGNQRTKEPKDIRTKEHKNKRPEDQKVVRSQGHKNVKAEQERKHNDNHNPNGSGFSLEKPFDNTKAIPEDIKTKDESNPATPIPQVPPPPFPQEPEVPYVERLDDPETMNIKKFRYNVLPHSKEINGILPMLYKRNYELGYCSLIIKPNSVSNDDITSITRFASKIKHLGNDWINDNKNLFLEEFNFNDAYFDYLMSHIG